MKPTQQNSKSEEIEPQVFQMKPLPPLKPTEKFDLKDSLGNPTATAIFERVPNTGTYPIP